MLKIFILELELDKQILLSAGLVAALPLAPDSSFAAPLLWDSTRILLFSRPLGMSVTNQMPKAGGWTQGTVLSLPLPV